jgi:hypothetical protein
MEIIVKDARSRRPAAHQQSRQGAQWAFGNAGRRFARSPPVGQSLAHPHRIFERPGPSFGEQGFGQSNCQSVHGDICITRPAHTNTPSTAAFGVRSPYDIRAGI